jgi:cholesterol oxidase
MREDPDGLPRLSPRVGQFVRTNGEALMGVLSLDSSDDHSIGITITSIVRTNENVHIEPVRYGAGSDFFRLFILPHTSSPSALGRIAGALWSAARSPWKWARALTVPQFARRCIILMYMSGVDEGINLRLGRSMLTGYRRALVSERNDTCVSPSAHMPEAHDLARRLAEKLKGVRVTLLHEMLLGASTTAHILGGARMGRGPDDGVIDTRHSVFGYEGLYVIDASAVSANPGINPALTIAALAERAMGFIPSKN